MDRLLSSHYDSSVPVISLQSSWRCSLRHSAFAPFPFFTGCPRSENLANLVIEPLRTSSMFVLPRAVLDLLPLKIEVQAPERSLFFRLNPKSDSPCHTFDRNHLAFSSQAVHSTQSASFRLLCAVISLSLCGGVVNLSSPS